MNDPPKMVCCSTKNKYNAVVEYQKENLEQVNPQLHKSLGIFNSRFVDNDNTLSDTARQEEFSETEVNGDKVSYSERVNDPETLAFLNKQEREGNVIKTYKAMQIIDGKLYSPMAAKVKGEDGKYHLS